LDIQVVTPGAAIADAAAAYTIPTIVGAIATGFSLVIITYVSATGAGPTVFDTTLTGFGAIAAAISTDFITACTAVVHGSVYTAGIPSQDTAERILAANAGLGVQVLASNIGGGVAAVSFTKSTVCSAGHTIFTGQSVADLVATIGLARPAICRAVFTMFRFVAGSVSAIFRTGQTAFFRCQTSATRIPEGVTAK